MNKLKLSLSIAFLLSVFNAGALNIDSTSVIGKIMQRVTFTGYAQLGWEYHDNSSPSNEFLINKLVFITNVKVTKKMDAFLMFDFKGFTLHELWMSYAVFPELKFKVGQFKTPFSIENPISPSKMGLITQTSLVTTDMICGGSPLMMPGGAGRDLGITMFGEFLRGRISYDVAVMSGAGRNKRDNNSQKDFVARIGVMPLETLKLSGSMILGTGNTAVEKIGDEYVSVDVPALTGIKANGNFSRRKFAAGAELKTAPLDVRGEWMWGKDCSLKSNGCYITATAKNVLTRGLELIASYDHLDNYRGIQNRYSAGIQYWFLKKCRIQAGYYHNKWTAGPKENAFLTQLQLAF